MRLPAMHAAHIVSAAMIKHGSAPVSLISTTQPSVIFSKSRSRHASKSRRPGAWSCRRMLSMRMGRPDSVEHTRRCRKCVLPSNLSTPDDICNDSHGSPSCKPRRADACATAAPSVEPAQPSHCCNDSQPCSTRICDCKVSARRCTTLRQQSLANACTELARRPICCMMEACARMT